MAETARPGRRWRSLAPTAALAAGCIVVYAIAASGGGSTTAPDTSPRITSSATSSPTVNGDAAIPYEIVDGVTISPYLPPAEPLTADVLDRVDSGWVLAAYEGGLLAPERLDGGMLSDGYRDFATSGPRVAYLVSPEREVFEAANLTELGVSDVVAWSPERGMAVSTTGIGEWLRQGDLLRVIDLRTGSLSTGFAPCPEGSGYIWVDPTLEGWAVGGACLSSDSTQMRSFFIELGDTADPVPSPWSAVVGVSDSSTRVVDDYLVLLHDNSGQITDQRDREILLSVSSHDGVTNAIGIPRMPDGVAPLSCALVDLGGGTKALQCSGWSGGDTGMAVYYLAFINAENARLDPVLEWVENPAFAAEGGFEPGCVLDGVYGTRTFNQTVYGKLGLERWDAIQIIDIRRPTALPSLALQCEGFYEYGVVIRAVGGLYQFEREEGGWTVLLPATVVPATGAEPERYVAGVTDLGVFVAP